MINTGRPTLHLVLKTKWFRMICDGTKTVEYREIKQYYGRLFACGQIKINGEYYDACQVDICFHLDYAKKRPSMLFACNGLSIGVGKPEWGAEPNVPYYRIGIGVLLDVENYNI